MTQVQRSRFGRVWLIKTLVFMLVLLVLGVWGAIDAWIVYPKAGERHAEWAKWKYLDAAASAGMLSATASLADPAAEYARLQVPETTRALTRDANDPTSPRQAQALVELARLTWLRSLDRIGKLNADHTQIADPRRELETLTAAWLPRPQPKSLSRWDIPVQYVFVVVGLGGGLALLGLLLRVKSRVYTWNAEEQRLTLPGGTSITPADLAEVDKRRWDKFLVYLKIKPEHSTLGGQEIRIDLYRHHPVEEWVLAMERAAFPPTHADTPDTRHPESEHAGSQEVSVSSEADGGGDRGGGG